MCGAARGFIESITEMWRILGDGGLGLGWVLLACFCVHCPSTSSRKKVSLVVGESGRVPGTSEPRSRNSSVKGEDPLSILGRGGLSVLGVEL